jgi:hypothetical protein
MSDQGRKESDSSSSTRNNGIKDKIVSKISSTMGKSQEDNNVNLSESARVSNNVRTVILALFALIGFIILVFAVFTASVGAQLDQVQFANSVFIAAIVGAFTLIGVIVYQIRGGSGK